LLIAAMISLRHPSIAVQQLVVYGGLGVGIVSSAVIWRLVVTRQLWGRALALSGFISALVWLLLFGFLELRFDLWTTMR
jgi:hypothetical protein